MMKLVLDTNFLVDLARFKIDLAELHDLLEPVELCVFNKTLDELNSLKDKAKHGKFAKIGLKLIEKNRITMLESASDVDASLLSLDPKDFIVATNDKKLRGKLKERGMKTIYVRARKHLAIG